MRLGSRVLSTVVLALVIVAIGYLGVSHWPQVQTFVWHLRHGNSIGVGVYNIQVPRHWLVTMESEGYASLMNTARRGREGSGLFINPIIIVISKPLGTSAKIPDLDYFRSSEQKWLERKGVRDIEEQRITAGDETLICMGGSIFRDIVHLPNTTTISMYCKSSGGLDLMFSGQRSDLQEFYRIAGQIRKR